MFITYLQYSIQIQTWLPIYSHLVQLQKHRLLQLLGPVALQLYLKENCITMGQVKFSLCIKHFHVSLLRKLE